MKPARSKSSVRRKSPLSGTEAVPSDTPLWNKYYQAMRKRVRFPRYYKHALNW